jgi:hypothetical protein
MAVLKSIPMQRVIAGKTITTSEITMVTDSEYTSNGECLIITKENNQITILLDDTTTDHIIIKSLVPTKIRPKSGKIDEEFHEINTDKGASVELYFSFGNWYIVSSDGIKEQ